MDYIWTLLYYLTIVLIILKLYLKITTGWCKSHVCLIGKTAIVTGANCGIGYETAIDFAKRGARVILACRNEERAEEARNRIIRDTNNNNVFVKIVDLCSFDSVRKFATDINNTEKNWDILVNNAGLGGYGEELTTNGHLVQMQANYYGPYLLTRLLVDHISDEKKSYPRRIVNVASVAAKYSTVDVDNLDTFYGGKTSLYARSKLCNILFTIELASRLRKTNITTYSLHPGIIRTEICRKMPAWKLFVTNLVFDLLAKTAIEGAQTTIYCALTKDIEPLSGENFHDCQYVSRYKSADDISLAKKLWTATEKIVQL